MASDATALMLLQILGYGLFFFLMLQCAANRRRGRVVLAVVFWAIVSYAVLGLVMFSQFRDTWFGIEKMHYKGSLTGPFVNRNSSATFLAMGLTLGAVFFVESLKSLSRDRLRPTVLVLACVVLGVALVLTDSRMGIAAGAVGAALALVAGGARAGWGTARTTLLVLGVAIAGSALLAVYGAGVLERVLVIESAASSRGLLYAQVWSMIASRPLLGFGGGSFEIAFPLFHALPLTGDYVWDKAHSTYLALWAELGLVGGSLPLVFFAALGLKAVRSFLSSGDWVPGLSGLACLVVAALHSLVDFSLEIPANVYVLLTILSVSWHAHTRSAPPRGNAQ